jgi:G:T/U-mismatch repair DNA glycosylase
METIISFDPVIGVGAKVLILGTMPGAKSLEVNEYYGFDRNQFWRIMGDLFLFNQEICYGGMARDIYMKHFKDKLMEIKAITLYSTSPANVIKYEKKLEQWRIIKDFVIMSD